MVEVIMPKMGDAMEEGVLVEWTKKEGDFVNSGDVIGSIQTDKAIVELTAPASGVLSGILVRDGETVPVGANLAAILSKGESLPEGWGSDGKATAKPQGREEDSKAKAEQTSEATQRAQQETAATVVATKEKPISSKASSRVFASPLARRLAEDAGLDLSEISGTGPQGRIVERDVKSALSGEKKQPVTSIPSVSLKAEERKLTFLQKITAERTTQSKQQVPHYYVTVEVDLENLEDLRNMIKAQEPDTRLTINDFIIKASAMALAEKPHINASFVDGMLKIYGNINIGVATAVPDGLTVPVIKNVESKSLRTIAAEIRELTSRARENKLKPEELTGSTFSISNMGMYDVENFAAIINQPNGAIIAVSTGKKVPVVVEGEEGDELEVRMRMKVTGSFDHRIIDGALGAEFMGVLKKYLENPIRLLA